MGSLTTNGTISANSLSIANQAVVGSLTTNGTVSASILAGTNGTISSKLAVGGVFAANSPLQVNGAIATAVGNGAGATLSSSDSVFLSTTGTVILPAAAAVTGRQYTIKKTDSSAAGDVTIDPNGAETIEGALTYVLTTLDEFVVIVSNGTNWLVTGGN